MADVLIRGIEMPKNDDNYVIITVYGDGGVVYGPLNRPHVRYKHRAIPLPKGHGKIIDGDALWGNMTVEQSEAFQKGLAGTIELFEMLEAATPIVPAEGDKIE